MKLQFQGETAPRSDPPSLSYQAEFQPEPASSVQTAAWLDANLYSEGRLAERHVQEWAWLSQIPHLSPIAAGLLAARATATAAAIRGWLQGASQPHHSLLNGLTAIRPDRGNLENALRVLPGLPVGSQLCSEDEAVVGAMWPLAAPTEHLLASGGDERLTLDPRSGLNKYGCSPWPRPELISFGSCTASTLSEPAFAAAEAARRSLFAEAFVTSPATALAEASEAIGTALLRYFGIEDLAQAVLAASGTDAALVVTGLLSAENPGDALTSVLVSPAETGSGVPDAVQGLHFAASAPSGRRVGKGEPIDGLIHRPDLITVALRDETGVPRSRADITGAVTAAIDAGIARGRVVLHAIDGSKTGLTAPDRWTCQQLAARYGDRLDVVIDACQARIEPTLVRWYLEQGFAVLITGSKFFGAPGFCGAVLFPRRRLARITRAGRLPAGLASYARLDAGFGSRRCPGLVLRWTAALHAMAQFADLDVRSIRSVLQAVSTKIHAVAARNTRLHLIDAPRPPGMGWSDMRSVFTLAVRCDGTFLSAKDLRPIYEDLGITTSAPCPSGDIPCQIGQPVELGSKRIGGLRIAISSAQVADGVELDGALDLVVGKLAARLKDADARTR
jgi:hypothetical protein